MTLTLGKEEYTSEGGSIKKAQHAAASEAIQKTKYRHPPAKAHPVRSESVILTPTVELNALAMKRREKAVYNFDPPSAGNLGAAALGNSMAVGGGGYGQSNGAYGQPPSFAYRGMNGAPQQMMRGGRYPSGPSPSMTMGDIRQMGGRGRGGMMKSGLMHGGGVSGPGRMVRGSGGMMVAAPGTEQVHVTLEVGGMQFSGFGFTAQAARHNAASKALEVLRKIPVDGQQQETENRAGGATAAGEEDGEAGKADSKSPVSMIHEIALKRSMTVAFSVKNETGPSHMKVFFTVCTVGELVVEGQGNSKKASKKHAAEKMYQELLKLPPLQGTGPGAEKGGDGQKGGSVRVNKKKTPETVKKKPKQVVIKPEVVEPTEELNAISKLMQIQQAKKGKEPLYLLVDQRGTPRRREFEMSVEVDGVTMTGTGPNKKMAKRIAAESK